MPRDPGKRSPDLASFSRGRGRLATALAVLAVPGLPACVSDPDCEICDPDDLILQSIAGVNYAGKQIRLLGPECVGDQCPGPIQEGQYLALAGSGEREPRDG